MKLFVRSMTFPALSLLAICFSSVSILKAQPKSVVFTVAGESVEADEFEFQFLKNRTDKSTKPTSKELDEYVELYSVFKMKVAEARAAGMDTLTDYINECQYQRAQIAPNYRYDRETSDQLVKEAYERMQYEIRASHILIFVAPDARPEDTLSAYNKMNEYRNHLLIHPNDFANYAKLYSEDPSAALNGGDLGYFTVFNLVYPFENACYQTPVGQVSQITRTQFGYHLILVTDKRKNPGEINFKQVLISIPEDAGLEQKESAKLKIDQIYEQAVAGTSIDELARNFSDDKATSSVGGESGFVKNSKYVGDVDRQMVLNKAYELEPYSFSKPFQTKYGWHIVQKVEVRPIPPFEKMKRSLENQVSRDARSLKSIESLIQKVQEEDHFTMDEIAGEAVRSKLDTQLTNGVFKKDEFPQSFTYKYKPWLTTKKGKKKQSKKYISIEISRNTPIFTLGDEKFTVENYLDFLVSFQRKTPLSPSDYSKLMMEDWVKDETVGYQDRHLEEKVPEFRFLYNEFKEGILMFNFTRIKIWERPLKDSVGLQAFFNENRDKYRWDDRIDLIAFTSQRKGLMDTIALQLNKGLSADSIRRVHTARNPIACDYKMGKYEAADSFLFPNPTILTKLFLDETLKSKKNMVVKLGKVGNSWVVVKYNSFLPAGLKELEETKGPVTSDFQDFLEKAWVRDMKSRYAVNINSEVLESIRTRICQP